jgi:hypothetical protein
VPDAERDHQQRKEQRRPAGISDSERAVGEIGHGGAGGRGCHDHKPVEQRRKGSRGNLRNEGGQQDANENQAADRIAERHRHRNRVAAGFAKRGCEYLDEPEHERDFGNLARRQV